MKFVPFDKFALHDNITFTSYVGVVTKSKIYGQFWVNISKEMCANKKQLSNIRYLLCLKI